MRKNQDSLLAAAFVMLFLVGAFSILGQWNGLQQERLRLREEEQLLRTAQARLARLQALERQSAQLANDWEVLEQLLPTSALVQDLLRDLQTGADLAEMNFRQISFAEQETSEDAHGLAEMPMHLYFEGSYHKLMNFLDYLLLYERAIRLDELNLTQMSEGLTINIRASAFYAAE